MSEVKWKVNDGWQVAVGDKVYVGGDTFSATAEQVAEFAHLVTRVPEKAHDKALAAPEPRSTKDDVKAK